MREALGPHSNAHVFYPIGALCAEAAWPFRPHVSGVRRFIVAFGGSLADWYGPMLEHLVVAAEAQNAPVEFRFYGSRPSWTKEFDTHARSAGIFRGHLPFEELRVAMREADALLLPMGFDERVAIVERTSFKTKFLDYLAYQKPITVWGPEYCSAVRVAREFDSAEICVNSDPGAILQLILLLAQPGAAGRAGLPRPTDVRGSFSAGKDSRGFSRCDPRDGGTEKGIRPACAVSVSKRRVPTTIPMRRIVKYLYAKYRAYAPLSCFESPRSDLLRGWRRWRWLVQQRQTGRLIEPSVRVQGDLAALPERLLLGSGIHLDLGVILWLGEPDGTISLGERVYVGPYSCLGTSTHKLQIAADTMIGARSYIITENHRTRRRDVPYARQGYEGADIHIGTNVWIGCHVTVLPGVTIGDHAIIGAGAVVTKNVPAGETWAGVPANRIAG